MLHKFTMNGYYIIIDVNSGSVHSVSPVVYEIAEHYDNKNLSAIFHVLKDKYAEEEILEGYSEVKELYDRGLVFSEPAEIENLKREPVLKALCLSVAHDCNLKCRYCFAEEGEYGGKRSLMTFETGKAAIDYLIENSKTRKNLEIDFFGGEPLMNFEVVKEIVEYARGLEKEYNKNFRFTITTNGLLLDDEKIDYINKNMQNIVLSLDGRKEVNDKMRKTISGAGSYDLIIDKFKKVAESRNQNNYYIRGTFTKNNLDFASDVAHFAKLGFRQISVEPVVCEEGLSLDYEITDADLPVVFKEYENLAKMMIQNYKNKKYNNNIEDFNFFHFMLDLSGGPCIYKRILGCGAGNEYMAVTPEGDLYPCHQFIGRDGFKIGSVYEKSENENVSIKEIFEGCNVFAKEECSNCWAKYYCGGGCCANAHSSNNDIYKPYKLGCEMQKKRIECSLMLIAAMADIDENFKETAINQGEL